MTSVIKRTVLAAGAISMMGLIGAPAVAEEPITIQGANKYAEKDALKIICKRSLQTGTRMKTQKCETKQQWTKEEEYAKREGKEILNTLRIETRRD
jgi:hypothetical protein